MKLLLIIFLLFSTYINSQDSRTITIIKNTKGSFNIYDNSGKLLSEYTKFNSDSSTRKTLSDIFFEADSVKNRVTKVEIVNIPKDSWWNSYSPFISVLIGVFFGWLFSHFSQKILIRKQFVLNQKETQLNDFINTSSEYLTSSFLFKSEILQRSKDFIQNRNEIGFLSNDTFKTITSDLMNKSYKLAMLLSVKTEMERKLSQLLASYAQSFPIPTKKMDEITSIEDRLNKYYDEIINLIPEVIEKRRNELN